MTQPELIRLSGLDPFDPLGYLATLGVLAATDEKLLPSDAPVIAYRKLHRAHYRE